MKNFLIIALLSLSCNAMGMKKQEQKTVKEFSKAGTLTLCLHNNDNTVTEVPKIVVVVTPTAMSPAKAETYFRKNSKTVNAKAKSLVDLTVSLMQHNEVGAVAYEQDPDDAHWNKDLFELAVHPESKFIYYGGLERIFLERDLGGDKNNWYYTQQIEVTHNEDLTHKGLCTPLIVQCHHDKAGVHDKIWVSELERLYAESGLPKLVVAENVMAISHEQLEQEGMIATVKTSDERLRTLAMIFVTTYPKYKHISAKK